MKMMLIKYSDEITTPSLLQSWYFFPLYTGLEKEKRILLQSHHHGSWKKLTDFSGMANRLLSRIYSSKWRMSYFLNRLNGLELFKNWEKIYFSLISLDS